VRRLLFWQWGSQQLLECGSGDEDAATDANGWEIAALDGLVGGDSPNSENFGNFHYG
jgi:hypothetical protein